MVVSNTKAHFLHKVGIDLENLPEEFEKTLKSYESSLTKEEQDFLFSDSYTKEFVLPFSMKDIVGTTHPVYKNKTVLEAFLITQRGDENINKFFSNPAYYSETLRQPNQTFKFAGHDTPIELNRDAKGDCYITGGNNRLMLLMMIYLKELSDAKTEEEKNEVNKKYTFYAEVRSLPKDKEVNNTIFMLKELYGDNIKFLFKGTNPDDCHYQIFLGDQEMEITNVNELKILLHQAYSLEGSSATDLYNKLVELISSYNHLKYQDNPIKVKLLIEICPNIEEVKDLFLGIRIQNPSNKIFEGYDLTNINYDTITELLKTITTKINEENMGLSVDVPSSPKM